MSNLAKIYRNKNRNAQLFVFMSLSEYNTSLPKSNSVLKRARLTGVRIGTQKHSLASQCRAVQGQPAPLFKEQSSHSSNGVGAKVHLVRVTCRQTPKTLFLRRCSQDQGMANCHLKLPADEKGRGASELSSWALCPLLKRKGVSIFFIIMDPVAIPLTQHLKAVLCLKI